MRPNRRAWLATLSRAAALLAAARVWAPSSAGPSGSANARPGSAGYPFTLGVASGQPRSHSVVLWTRLAPRPYAPFGGLTPQPVVLRWQLALDEGFGRILREGEVIAHAELAHSVRVRVDGLPSARAFFYRFIAGGAVSPIGRTRTAPAEADDPGRLRFALASCQHYEQGWYAAHREMAGRELDFVLFVGDYIYDNSNPKFIVRPHEVESQPCSVEAFRARYATYKLDPDLQANHAAHPWIVTWDDHEVRNDYAAAFGIGELSAQEFLRVRTAAYQAYFEHQALLPEQRPVAGALQLYDRFTWGQLAEIWTLDGRQYRSRQAGNDHHDAGGTLVWRSAELRDPRRTMLGAPQERWLQQGLAASPRRWKLIGQGTQICPSGVDTPVGRVVYTDGWDGYAPARERLLSGIAESGQRDVLLLGGDVHRHVAARLRARPEDPRSPVVASEFVTSSITTRGASNAKTAWMRRCNPDIVHARSDERGYMLCELDKLSLNCDARATAFPVAAAATLHSQVRFVVEAGRAGPQPG